MNGRRAEIVTEAGTTIAVTLPAADRELLRELTDIAARMLLAPAEVPIDVVTAFLGAPFFAIVLRRAWLV